MDKRIREQQRQVIEKLSEQFEFRTIRGTEVQQAIAIEQTCFPPNEACTASAIRDRIRAASDLFWTAVDRQTGKVAGFLNGISTDEMNFRDAFFTDASLYQVDGKNNMLLGLDVLPEYRNQGLAHAIMFSYLQREEEKGRERVILTCHKEKIPFYERMGYRLVGISASVLGGEVWYDMEYILNQ